ncbi:MAG: ribulose-phosphate 3-epimerase [Oscillospiraceae bacterium]|nr:ribulose-phosphate 3-epimerase [Oscillospiraceae bacterium]
MVKLSPSVLSADFAHLGNNCCEVLDAGADMIHFDVMDGHFVDNLSFGLPVLQGLHKALPNAYMDVHLMITNPLKYVKEFVDAGANCITFHIECSDSIRATSAAIRAYGCAAGLAINPDTPAECVFPYLDGLSIVLVMGVTPGHGGQAFNPVALDKLRKLRAECNRRGLSPYLSVDGGVKAATTGPQCVEAGATLLVAGSAVFGAEDKVAAVQSFKNL